MLKFDPTLQRSFACRLLEHLHGNTPASKIVLLGCSMLKICRALNRHAQFVGEQKQVVKVVSSSSGMHSGMVPFYSSLGDLDDHEYARLPRTAVIAPPRSPSASRDCQCDTRVPCSHRRGSSLCPYTFTKVSLH
jgi:hypothetical protein